MEIRPSLRLYVLLAMLVTGIVMILGLSALSVKYFISGMDVAMREAMIAQSQKGTVDPGKPLINGGFTVAVRWRDLPETIRLNFDEREVKLNVISKKIIGKTLLSPPKAGYFVMKFSNGKELRYVSSVFSHPTEHFAGHSALPHFVTILITALTAIGLFFIILTLVLRKVASPVEQLKSWAKQLDKDNLSEPTPDFHYSELNILANIIRDSLSSVQASLAREQQFLSYASHELRTPIAVTRTNSELLGKLIQKGATPEKQLAVIDRIERAGMTMTDLTDTLLWLTRQQDKALPKSDCKLGELLIDIQCELRYLLIGKPVTVTIDTDDFTLQLPLGLVRIVLANVIRNAFQHTAAGRVKITQVGGTITIVNHNHGGTVDDNNLGFGLGLQLTERLLLQYDWPYQNEAHTGGRKVYICFS